MKNKSIKKTLKIYGYIGKSLCACAGALVGIATGGPLLAIPGFALGITGAHYLEKLLIK